MAPKRDAETAAVAEPDTEEAAFPRGGGHSLPALEAKQLRAEGAAQARAEAAHSRKSGKKARTAGVSDLDAEFGGGGFLGVSPQIGKLPKFVEVLKVKGLTVGTRLWGAVLEVTPRHLSISLPNGLRGTVSPQEASDVLSGQLKKSGFVEGAKTAWPPGVPQLPQLFYVGQLVRCIVVDLGDKKRVGLSLNVGRLNGGVTDALYLGAVLPGVVRGIEDHGYSLTFGIKGATGFLKKEHHVAAYGEGAVLTVGALVEVAITNVADRRMIGVTSSPAAVATGTLRDNVATELGQLLPGALVNARVKAVLSDGLLVTFLTYFTGTIDANHLGQDLTSFEPGQRLKARILAVNPTTKAAALSLEPHLLNFTIHPDLPKVGTVVENATVDRINTEVGIMLTLPMEGSTPSTVAFAHISALSDTRIDKINKAFKVGQTVTARVIGSRPLDGLAVVSLQPSVVSQTLMSYAELSAGQKVNGTIAAIDERGATLTIAPGIKAFVPLEHLSESGGRKGASKWAVGVSAAARVLTVDAASRRCRATLKKALVASKLPQLCTLQDAQVGVRAHGIVTGVTSVGVFVGFYNGLAGLIPTRTLGLAPDQTPEDSFQTGQVLKVGVVSVDAARNRLRLALSSGAAAAAAAEAANVEMLVKGDGAAAISSLKAGTTVVQGTITKLHTASKDGKTGPYVELGLKGGGVAHLAIAHLSDHPTAASELHSQLVEGVELGPLLVLETLERIGVAKVTRKASLLAAAAAGSLPSAIQDVRESALFQGYIASLTADAAYVRFGGTLTGRAGLAQLADSFVTDPRLQLTVGQSVRAQVIQVDNEKGRFSVTLKPALVASPDAALLSSLFTDLHLAATLRNKVSAEDAAIPWESFPIGSVTKGTVNSKQEYGLTVDLAADRNVVGLVEPDQEADNQTDSVGPIDFRVLDVNKADGVVHLSLRPALLPAVTTDGKAGKDARIDKWKVDSQKVEATVELINDDYLIMSLPVRKPGRMPALGFLPTLDYNMLTVKEAGRRYEAGQTLVVTVCQLPLKETGHRLLLHTTPQSEAAAAIAAAAEAKKVQKSKVQPGELVEGTVIAITPLAADIKLSSGEKARLHATEWMDSESAAALSTAGAFAEAHAVGSTVSGVVLGAHSTSGAMRQQHLDLSTRPSAVAAANKGHRVIRQAVELSSLQGGQDVQGFVQEVGPGFVFVALSATLRGRLHVADCVGSLLHLSDLSTAFPPGQPLRLRVLQVNRAKCTVDLSQQRVGSGAPASPSDPAPGSVVTGCVIRASGDGLTVHLPEGRKGRVCLSDIHDKYVDNALAGISSGTMVRGMVLPPDAVPAFLSSKDSGVPLSLKTSLGGGVAGITGDSTPATLSTVTATSSSTTPVPPSVGDQVHGYITGLHPKAGAFVILQSRRTAHIKKSQLADGYVQDIAAEFPIGKHVRGRVTAVEGTRIEMSLRTAKQSNSAAATAIAAASVAAVPEGAVLPGVVRRVETFGVFVEVGGKGGPSGLAHISELSDGFVGNIQSQFQTGQEVRVKVLRVDAVAGKLSLSLKASATGATSGADKPDVSMDGSREDDEGSEASQDLDDIIADRIEAAEMEAVDGEETEDEDLQMVGSKDGAIGQASSDGSHDSEPESDQEGSDSDMEDAMAAAAADTPVAPVRTLELGADEPWAATDSPSDTEQAAPHEDAGAGATVGKLSKQQKKRAKTEKESAIRAAEMARVDDDAEPDTAEAFEALVAGEPHSSRAWIRYMAFLLTVGDTDGARGIAERALSTINYREEEEKFNVWKALMNLENSFGSPPEEAVMKVFQRAAQHTDSKRLHLATSDMFLASNRFDAARTIQKAACRKFNRSAKVWLRALTAELSSGGGGSAEAQRVLDRALAALPTRKHTKVATQAALAEFRDGSAERGRSILEGILRNYPKRLDLWSVYLDQEIKAGDQARTRALMERTITLQLPAKKMKFFFKRYLQYEKEFGDEASRQHVQDKAREYVAASQ